MSNIFDSLLVEKYRPQTMNDLVLESSVREYFANAIQVGEIPHLLFCGPAGTGKTTLAKILAKEMDAVYRYINASDERGIDAIRDKVVPFAQTKSIDGKLKLIILDEVDGLTGDAQRSLRNIIEEYSDNLRFVLTANYKNRLSSPIRSRVIPFELMPPMDGVTSRIVKIIAEENISVAEEQKPKLKELIHSCYPDIRRMIGLIQKNTRDGVLDIRAEADVGLFARDVIKRIRTDKNINTVREFIIQNESDFNSDYLILLKGLFEEVYAMDINHDRKAQALVLISDAMYKHQFVMDFEINAFSCIIQLHTVLT